MAVALLPFPALLALLLAGSALGSREPRRHGSFAVTISAEGDFVPELEVPYLEVPQNVSSPGLPGLRSAECFQRLEGKPGGILCPQACPFLRAEPAALCSFACVPEADCGAAGPAFGNVVTRRCEACQAAACLRCETALFCLQCQQGFRRTELGACVSDKAGTWRNTTIIATIVLGVLLWYAFCLPLRPVVNQHVLDKALEFREECKFFDEASGLPFRLEKNLGREYVAGVGIVLHFRWQQMVLVWSAVLLVVYFALSLCFGTRASAIEHHPGSPEAFETCQAGILDKNLEYKGMERAYFWTLVAVYLGSTGASFYLAIANGHLAMRTEDEVHSMEDFALLATGLPIVQGDVRVEDEVAAFFQERFPEISVVGAVPCWDYRDKATREWIEGQAHDEVYKLDCAYDKRKLNDASRSLKRRATQLLMMEKPENEDQMWLRHARLEFLDGPFNDLTPALEGEDEDEEKSPEEIKRELEKLETTGDAFVVFQTERQCKEVLRRARAEGLLWDRDHEVVLERFDSEPETVNWHGFGVGWRSFYWKIGMGNLMVLVAIVVKDILFYSPSTMNMLMLVDVQAMVGGAWLQPMMLGLLTVITNLVFVQVVGKVAENAGFRFMSYQRQFFMVEYILVVFLNTLVDLIIMLVLAQGFAWTNNSLEPQGGKFLTAKAIAEQPVIQRELFTMMYHFLYPSVLLTPIICEPPTLAFLNYLLPMWIIRSRRELDVSDAEPLMVDGDFDFNRYADIIVTLMLVAFMPLFVYRDLYVTFGWLLFSLLFTYAWDHYRFLRASRRSLFPETLEELTSHFLLALPCAILASVLVFRFWAAAGNGALGEAQRRTAEEVDSSIFFYMALAFVLHLALHFSALVLLVPQWTVEHGEHDDTVPYQEVAKRCPCTWFNASPVFTLRSKYVYGHEPFCVPYEVGKAYLLEPNPEVGAYFSTEESPKEHRAKVRQLKLREGA